MHDTGTNFLYRRSSFSQFLQHRLNQRRDRPVPNRIKKYAKKRSPGENILRNEGITFNLPKEGKPGSEEALPLWSAGNP